MKYACLVRAALSRLQRGAVAVEFALLSALFMMTLLVGIIELGRTFFYMNATAEATRWGARVAVVCDVSEATRDFVRLGMRQYVNVLNDGNIDIAYDSVAGTYRSVTVSVTGATLLDPPLALGGRGEDAPTHARGRSFGVCEGGVGRL